MRTLFPSNYNWGVFILACLIIRLAFVDMSIWSYLAVVISIYQFSLLFNSIGHILPTRHLLGSFMCLQFFVGSTFAYNGLDRYQYFKYKMRIPESEYFSYVIPAVVLFILGLHILAGRYKGEIVDQKSVEQFVKKNPRLPYIFIGIGLLASVVSGYFSSQLAFVFYLLGSFKFIGLFLQVIGGKRLKILPLVVVIGSIFGSSLASAMFHDLLTWLVFTAAVFGIKYRFDFKTKLIGLSAFVFLAITIQVLKGAYRSSKGDADIGKGAETFANLYEEQSEAGGILNFNSLAISNVRINQGFIITNIMQTVPEKVPFANGEEMNQILEAAFLPRILAPNKLRAGDQAIFEKYSGIPLTVGTSMGLSSIGDAYINYGVIGGSIFMFILGLAYCEVLNIFHRQSFVYPVLILFIPLVFYYPIRPDCELQTILGHLVKSCFLIFVMIQVWKFRFKMDRRHRRKIVIT